MPLRKPRKGESQADWMKYCMHELATSETDRPQDQMIAICMSSWQDRSKAGAPSPHKGESYDSFMARCKRESDEHSCETSWNQFVRGEEQDPGKWDPSNKRVKTARGDFELPEPDDDEEYQDFIDRCLDAASDTDMDDDAAQDACDQIWSESGGGDDAEIRGRMKPGVTVYRTHSEPTIVGNNFVLSDESVDRMGEVISADGWELDNFKLNPIALFNHRADFPIGRWHDLAVKDGKLKGRLELARAKTSPRIDEIRALVDAGILRAVSVGFRPLEREPIDTKANEFFGPFRYLSQELVECSLVSVPANPNALALAKSLKVSPETIQAVFAGSGKRDSMRRRGIIGGSASSNGNKRRGAMSLTQRITDIQSQIVVKRDALAAHLERMDDSNVSDADLETTQNLNNEISQLERTRLVLVDSEKSLAGTLDGGGAKPKLPAIFAGNGKTKDRSELPITSTVGKKELDLIDLMVRGGTIAYVAKTRGHEPQRTRMDIYGDDEATKIITDIVTRTPSAPAMTSVTGWAAELVQQTWAPLMPLLIPNAILTRLSARGLSLQFGRAGRINIPTRSRTPSLAGSFVGEGQAIPVRQGAFTTQALVPKKMAVISTYTREMDEHSIPAIEGIIREAIQVDTSVAVDSVLIDANAATTIRPAGLLNGVAAITATAGGGLAGLVGDIKALIGALTTSTYGNVRDPVWLMNPTDALGAGLVSATNTGIFPFAAEIRAGTLAGIPIIDSSTVPVKTVILVDAADFVVADGGAPRFEMSDQATLHMEDTAPTDLVSGSPGTVASPQRSLFQTDSLALRMIWPVNWVQRRAGTVAWTQNVTWS